MIITLEDLREAIKLVDLKRQTKKYYFEDCWVEVDAATEEPLKIGLTHKGKLKIHEIFDYRGHIEPKGKFKTLYGIPIIETDFVEDD